MRIAITGAAGWIGRSVTARLERDHDLVLLDSVDPTKATIFDPDSPTGRRVLPLSTAWPYHRVDILDEESLTRSLAGVEVVVHLAARPTGDWDSAAATMNINVLGTFNVYTAAQKLGIRRVIAASSINAFGSFAWRVSRHSPVWHRLPLIEDEWRVPEDPYSLSKAIAEDIGWTFYRAFGIQSCNLRFAAVWPESRYERSRNDGLPRTTSWADDLYEWVHLDDVTEGIALATTVPHITPEPMVLGAGDTYAPEATLDLVREFRPELEAGLRHAIPGRSPLLSIARAQTNLGYNPIKSFN